MNPQVGYLIGLAAEYIQQRCLDDAERLLKQALKMDPKNSEIYRLLGVNFVFKKDLDAALEMFDRSIKIDPKNCLTHSNQGNVYRVLYQPELALKSYDKAIALQPNYPEVYNNKGNVLLDLSRAQEAIAAYGKAIKLDPSYSDAYHGLGNALKKNGNILEAIASYEAAAGLNASAANITASCVAAKMQICEWSNIRELIRSLLQFGFKENIGVHPFNLLSICDDPVLLLSLTKKYMLEMYPANNNLGLIEQKKRCEKISIGYFSADFRSHPVSLLVVEMLELHDRSKFEIIGISLAPSGSDEMCERIQNSFDIFLDVSKKTDLEISELARKLKIDIAVDLGGLTENARPGIFSYRAAPIQISYIGYLGTMGAAYYDYIIADDVIIPPAEQDSYVEKIMYLPSYQANDSNRQISERTFTREELGLPDKGFIYCCFNNNFKITPCIFDSWARILLAVEGSILFLYADNEETKKNLTQEAEMRGISPDRIIYAERLPRDEYLARYRVADLFLDTSPYNAGTTASDALWVGLPVLTYLGRSFSARMCGSLLNAIGLPELVTSSQQDYEKLAISIGRDPDKILELKNKLAENRLTTQLFNTKLFTQNIEFAYTKAYERYQSDLTPDHIY